MPALLRRAAPLRRRLLVPALLLLAGCGGAAGTGVDQPDAPGRAVLAHDVQTGELLWRKEVTPPVAATEPVLVGGVVLVHGGPLIAYDARSGQRLWSLEEQTQPQVAGELVVLHHERDVQAVEARTGRSLWRVPVEAGAAVHAGPGGVAVVTSGGFGQAGAVRLLRLDGEQAWQVPVAREPFAAHPGADVVAVAGLRADVVALSTRDGRELWRTASPAAPVVHVAQDRVLARQADAVAAYDARTGAELWRRPADDGGSAPLVVAGERVLVVRHVDVSQVLGLADGRLLDEVRAWDVELSDGGVVRAEPDELRFEGDERRWEAPVSTGARPVLWTDADDEVVVAVAGWGQPPTRD